MKDHATFLIPGSHLSNQHMCASQDSDQPSSAVTHETVNTTVHHIRHEEITREIHKHDVYHRTLPIIDVQVLPAKHFVPNPSGDGLVEVSADQLPDRMVDTHTPRHWTIVETVSKTEDAGDKGPKPGPRRFTARKFEGTDGDYREYVGEDGIPRTETTWVHPPTIDEDLKKRGLTQPLYMDEP